MTTRLDKEDRKGRKKRREKGRACSGQSDTRKGNILSKARGTDIQIYGTPYQCGSSEQRQDDAAQQGMNGTDRCIPRKHRNAERDKLIRPGSLSSPTYMSERRIFRVLQDMDDVRRIKVCFVA
jgi:hypothetical protein